MEKKITKILMLTVGLPVLLIMALGYWRETLTFERITYIEAVRRLVNFL